MQPTSWEVSVDHEHLVTTKLTSCVAQHLDGNCLFRSVYADTGPEGYADASLCGCLEPSPISCTGLRRCILPSVTRCDSEVRYT